MTDILRSYETIYKTLSITFILIASILSFEHPFWGLPSLRNLAAFYAQNTQCAQQDGWTVPMSTESVLSHLRAAFIPMTHHEPSYEVTFPPAMRQTTEDESVEIMVESCKSFLACRSFLIVPLYEWNQRAMSDLLKLKHKRQISMLFITKKGKVVTNHFMIQYSHLNEECDMLWKWCIKFYWK